MAWKVPFKRSGRIGSFSRDASEADDLQQQVNKTGATPILDCCRGQVVTACGVLRSVTVRPVAGSPALEADLYDGSGHLRLVWLGRRHIHGIEAGRLAGLTPIVINRAKQVMGQIEKHSKIAIGLQNLDE